MMARKLTPVISPISDYWTISFSPQNCLNERTNLLVADIINTCTDLLVVLVPIFFIWNLNLPIRQHAFVSSLFGLGALVVIAGVFRTIMFWHLGEVYDKTWAAYYVWLPSEIELYTGIVSIYSYRKPQNNTEQNSVYESVQETKKDLRLTPSHSSVLQFPQPNLSS